MNATTFEDWLGKDNKLGIDIVNKKYRYENESFPKWLDRVSGGNEELKQLIADKKFLFGGRVLSNRGVNDGSSLSNCYSYGYVDDDLDAIMQANTDLAFTYKKQGGQGISLTKIRPKGTPIGDRYESDGIIPFLRLFNQTTSTISQGSSRKGALMVSLDIRHKESENFIKIKAADGEISKANLSLEVDDEFMEAVKRFYDKGETIILHERRNYNGHEVEYDLTPINLYKLLVQNCYDWAEPACLFSNRGRNYNIMEFDTDYDVQNTNPCGEQWLNKHGCCNLGSLNLSEFVLNPYTNRAKFDHESFKEAISTAVESLDVLIDENANNHALESQKINSLNYRNIGLGVMGYATMLFKLGIEYGSERAKEFTNILFNELFMRSVYASSQLAEEKGPFPKYSDVVWESQIIKNHFNQHDIDEFKKYGLRNCSLISVAPTGTISTTLGVTGGCEPEFAISYKRKTESLNDGKDKVYEVNCKALNEYHQINDTKETPSYFISSVDINWKDRVDIQAIMQNHVDTAISSTVNLPNSETVEDVEKLYLYAWEQGLKGVTIYKAGCKREGILTTDNNDKKDKKTYELDSIIPISRGDFGKTIGTTNKYRTACGSLYITINRDSEGNIIETFVNVSKNGICKSNIDGISRMVSVALRSGTAVEEVVDQLKGINCAACNRALAKGEKLDGISCPDILAKAIQSEYDSDEIYIKKTKRGKGKNRISKPQEKSSETKSSKNKCKECGGELKFEGGCSTCLECGYSKCG